MSVTKWHAFGEGLAYPAPEALTHLSSGDSQFIAANEIWAAFRSRATISPSALLGPNAWIVNLSGDPKAVVIADRSVVRGLIRVERNGHVSIGEYCYVGDDVILSCYENITIEPNVLIAHGCQIFDNASHPSDPQERAAHYRAILDGSIFEPNIRSAPISVGRSAWLGLNTIVLPGSNIGANCIVVPGSVVRGDVPANTMVAGNPAEIVKRRSTDGD